MNDIISIPKIANISLLDEVNCNIAGLFPLDYTYLYDTYNILTKDFFYHPHYKLGIWDGKKSFFSKKGKTFIFLLSKIIPTLVSFGYKVNIIDNRVSVVYNPNITIDATYFDYIENPKTKTPYMLAEHQIESANIAIKAGSGILLAGTGFGKAQPLTSKVLTPTGWKLMGDICVGDYVMTPKNTITKVIGVFPQGETDVYEITCNDKSTARCSSDHLWLVHNTSATKHTTPFIVCDTKELDKKSKLNVDHRAQIPLIPVALDFPESTHIVPPYLLGILLPHLFGEDVNGRLLLGKLSAKLKQRIEENLKVFGITLRLFNNGYTLHAEDNIVAEYLDNIRVLQLDYDNITIPNQYIFCSANSRTEFLKGLCDTNAKITNTGVISINGIKESLFTQVQEMIWLHGGACKVSTTNIVLHHHDPCLFFRDTKHVTNYLNNSDKAHANITLKSRRVESVELVSHELTQCILVEDSDHLYVTDNCLITHNTILNATIIDIYGKQGCKTITIVPSSSLVSQTIKQFRVLQLDVGQYDGIVKDIEHQHIVSTWQSLQNNPNLIRLFQVVIADECHGSKAKALNKLLTEFGKDIPHRYGLTGTLPDHPSELLLVQIALGDIIFTSHTRELIAAGWLATPNISILQLDDISYLKDSGIKDVELLLYEEEQHFLRHSDCRTKWIANYIIEKQDIVGVSNTLVLINNISYGKKLVKLIPGAVFLHGSDKNKVRQDVYDLFEVQDDLVVICTKQIAGVGLSIDRIFNLIYIDGGKSFINTIQTIGRGLRKGRDKSSVEITDICSNMLIADKHLKQRIKYYKDANYPYKKFKIEYDNGDVNLC